MLSAGAICFEDRLCASKRHHWEAQLTAGRGLHSPDHPGVGHLDIVQLTKLAQDSHFRRNSQREQGLIKDAYTLSVM